MALSQVQIIQALGEALSWFERELRWQVRPSQLVHLTGRIGELYAAMITRGQMALSTNQRGYDVISQEGQRISVKTITTANHVNFNLATFGVVDRVIVLRINVDEGEASIEELLDCSADEARANLSQRNGLLTYYPKNSGTTRASLDALPLERSIRLGDTELRKYENGSIGVFRNDEQISPAMPVLRELAKMVGVDVLNGAGNAKNTRTLGADIVEAMGGEASKK